MLEFSQSRSENSGELKSADVPVREVPLVVVTVIAAVTILEEDDS